MTDEQGARAIALTREHIERLRGMIRMLNWQIAGLEQLLKEYEEEANDDQGRDKG